MCGGLPCIVSRNPGLQEVVGQAGLYFEPGDSDELAAAILALSGDPDRRAALANASVAQASRFTLDACSDLYRRLGVQLADPSVQQQPLERGESFYNPYLPEVVKDLLEKGIAQRSEGGLWDALGPQPFFQDSFGYCGSG